MRKKAFFDITIGEITQKAGVNRSTYYRNFNSKEDIVKHSFYKILSEFAKNNDIKNAARKDRLIKLFKHLLKYKKELMLIYNNGLSYCILDAFNEKYISFGSRQSLEEQYKAYWKIGGIYNSFLLWFSKNMDTPVEILTELFWENYQKSI
jgi:AcrR family transcriptional regulator